MTSGIYALVSLCGAALAEADLRVIGLAEEGTAFLWRAAGLAVRVVDAQPAAIDCYIEPEAVTVLAGYLDEAEELAGTLGMASDTAPAALAAAAVERFGSEAPEKMLGEWSLLRWKPARRELTLVASMGRRDEMLFAGGGEYVAVAPRAMRLGDLRWVGKTLDREGFALDAGKPGLRRIRTGGTCWKGIRTVLPGYSECFTEGKRMSASVAAVEDLARWEGNFEELVEATDAVGRRIMRQHLRREGRLACQLSGGLDSTLLSAWAALEQGPGREMFCVSCVAAPGSGLTDEKPHIYAAARQMGVTVREYWPAESTRLFPDFDGKGVEDFIGGGPGTYLVDAMYEAVRAGGGATVISGAYGEMNVSYGFQIPERRSQLRLKLALLRDDLMRRRKARDWPGAAFHLRFSREFLATLPSEWKQVWRKPPPRLDLYSKGDPLVGITAMAEKIASASTAGEHFRALFPYRDLRLQRLIARVPARMFLRDGESRPLARALLAGRVPDAVRLRQQNMPYSSDFAPRLEAQAKGLLERIPLFREAGVGRLLDLDWLASAARSAGSTPAHQDYDFMYALQGTAMAAEFLLWAVAHGGQL